ncbi:MAG: GH3 auxin-responsive promoter family protein, partial [Paramuribaculum sp.]|nr:GH3 auxin-responsive promoter family protein [Paramuribaculum sp.]
MINFTPVVRPYFLRRADALRRYAGHTEVLQRAELERMLRMAEHTLWGERYGFARINSYEEFAARVPVTDYTELRPYVMRMIAGERDILWRGVTRCFAQSSGTSDGKSKYIPITRESFKRSHYRGGSDVISLYLSLYPDSRLFAGKSFILGGSFANELPDVVPSGVTVGDLSANLIANINPVANMVRIPDKHTALMEHWEEKLPALVKAAANADVTNISGVPSWFLTVLRRLLEYTGAEHIHQVWRNLEVFFHGGISFAPYREPYDAIINPERMRYLETYNASEGFFAIQDTIESKAMLLLLDAGTFYEFVDISNPTAEPIPAWRVKQGGIYAMLITSCNGLWRYPIGDTVKIESVEPLRITIAGRTKHFINAFGEEVMVHNTDAAVAEACRQTGARVLNYTVAPVFTAARTKGRHQWLIEFHTLPADIDDFANRLDAALCSVNSDYQAKRSGSIFLDRLSITVAREGLFDRWLGSTGKLGGQRKVPRLSNDRTIMD